MSLVAYDSSDESGEEAEKEDTNVDNRKDDGNWNERTNRSTSFVQRDEERDGGRVSLTVDDANQDTDLHRREQQSKLFQNLPKPRSIDPVANVGDEDLVTTMKFEGKRKTREPVKISLPSMSEFKDVDEDERERKMNSRLKPSQKGTGLFALLPPPKGASTRATMKSLIPDAVKNRVPRPNEKKFVENAMGRRENATKSRLSVLDVDTDSGDETDPRYDKTTKTGKVDFFSLDDTANDISGRLKKLSPMEEGNYVGMDALEVDGTLDSSIIAPLENNRESTGNGEKSIGKILTSNVINLPKEEIRAKNKADIGPKLPIPEQEYNVDEKGNVAFDEKAIEYLCGKRGVKRKKKDFDEANIIEINGEDIKPDEREWLVKALTEEPAERPISMESAGPSTQSRKKHQITYLAHQAKAMEIELKNQWAQNRMTRKQTQSKYGF